MVEVAINNLRIQLRERLTREKHPWVLLEKGLTTPLCFKCGGHGHYFIICQSTRLYFCIEEVESESKVDPKEVESHKKEQLGEEGDYLKGICSC